MDFPSKSISLPIIIFFLSTAISLAGCGKNHTVEDQGGEKKVGLLTSKELFNSPLVEFKSLKPLLAGDFFDYYATLQGKFSRHFFKKHQQEDIEKDMEEFIRNYALRENAATSVSDQDPRLGSLITWMGRKGLKKEFLTRMEENMKIEVNPSVAGDVASRKELLLQLILAGDRADIEGLQEKLDEGEPFEEVMKSRKNRAKKRAAFKYRVGDGYFSSNIEREIFSLKKGDKSPIFHSELGYFIVRVKDILDEGDGKKEKQARREQYVKERVYREIMDRWKKTIPAWKLEGKEFYHLIDSYLNGNYVDKAKVVSVGGDDVLLFQLIESSPGMFRSIDYDVEKYTNFLSLTRDSMVRELFFAESARKLGMDIEEESLPDIRKRAKLALFLLDRLEEAFSHLEEEEYRRFFLVNEDEFIVPLKYLLTSVIFKDKKSAEECGESLKKWGYSLSTINSFKDKTIKIEVENREISLFSIEYENILDDLKRHPVGSSQNYLVSKTDGGYRLIYVSNIVPGSGLSYDDIKGYVKRYYFETHKRDFIEKIKGEELKRSEPRINEEVKKMVIETIQTHGEDSPDGPGSDLKERLHEE